MSKPLAFFLDISLLYFFLKFSKYLITALSESKETASEASSCLSSISYLYLGLKFLAYPLNDCLGLTESRISLAYTVAIRFSNLSLAEVSLTASSGFLRALLSV